MAPGHSGGLMHTYACLRQQPPPPPPFTIIINQVFVCDLGSAIMGYIKVKQSNYTIQTNQAGESETRKTTFKLGLTVNALYGRVSINSQPVSHTNTYITTVFNVTCPSEKKHDGSCK